MGHVVWFVLERKRRLENEGGVGGRQTNTLVFAGTLSRVMRCRSGVVSGLDAESGWGMGVSRLRWLFIPGPLY